MRDRSQPLRDSQDLLFTLQKRLLRITEHVCSRVRQLVKLKEDYFLAFYPGLLPVDDNNLVSYAMAAPSLEGEDSLFSTISWCRKILDDENFMLEPTGARISEPGSGMNSLISQTLNNNDTIQAWCSLYRIPTESNGYTKDEVRCLLALRPGLDGFTHVLHGGITATVLDEVMTTLVAVYRLSKGLSSHNVTADLRIKYLRPIKTPSTVMATAKVRAVENEKKYFVEGEILDCEGVVLAKGEGLFIHIQQSRL